MRVAFGKVRSGRSRQVQRWIKLCLAIAREMDCSTFRMGFVFLGNPPALPCAGGEPDDRGNVQLLDWLGDDVVDITDAISLLTFVFLGGPAHMLTIPGMEATGCVSIAGCPNTCD